jgi:hypothetical protein
VVELGEASSTRAPSIVTIREPPVSGAPLLGRARSAEIGTAVSGPPAPSAVQVEPAVFSDKVTDRDLTDISLKLRPLAEILVSAATETPLAIALSGRPGVGKSTALAVLAKIARAASRRGTEGAIPGTVFAQLVVNYADGPNETLAAATFDALCAADARAIAEEASLSSGDPSRAFDAARIAHDELCTRLESDRIALDDAEGKRARLEDTLLFQSPASQIDGFINGNRGQIESRLRRFGLPTDDDTKAYRNLLRERSAAGLARRGALATHAIVGYRGQIWLLVLAVLCFVAGFGLNSLHTDAVTQWLSASGSMGATIADAIASHGEALGRTIDAVFGLGIVLVAYNLWRAFSFEMLLARGLRFWRRDLLPRQENLDGTVRRLREKVASLRSDVEKSDLRLAAAAKRATATQEMGRNARLEFLPEADSAERSRAFLAQVSNRLSEANANGVRRLIFFVDNIDLLEPERALKWLERAASVLGPAMAIVVGFDSVRLERAAGSDGRARLERAFSIVVDIGTAGRVDLGRLLVRQLAARGADGALAEADDGAATARSITQNLASDESSMLAALAAYVRPTPRAIKRFINIYRLLRAEKSSKPALALAAVASVSDDPEILRSLKTIVAEPNLRFDESPLPKSFLAALRTVQGAHGGDIDVSELRAALDAAGRYTWPSA